MRILYCPTDNKGEAFTSAMSFLEKEDSVLLRQEGKMWLFYRHDKTVDIKPIDGFSVGLVYEDPISGQPYTDYVVGLSYNGDSWSSLYHTKDPEHVEVFFTLDRLERFLQQFEDHFYHLEGGKEIFLRPVMVRGGKAF